MEWILSLATPIVTLIGTLFAVVQGNRLTIHRIDQLETKVDKHNHLVERMAIAEQSIKSAHHRLDELREDI